LEVNHWNTLILTRWFVRLKDGREVNSAVADCAKSRTGQLNRRMARSR
jgi:hypothetical protein